MKYNTAQAVEMLIQNPDIEFEIQDGRHKHILSVDGTNILTCIREDNKRERPIFIDDMWTLKENESNA